MTFGSLFSGVGGIDLGLERAGLTCKWQVEIDPFCQKVLAKHWPQVKRYGDIRTINGNQLEPVDLLAGGFPCQDLSQAGKQAGIEGTRSGLWFEFARLIGELRPRYVLIENVAGLLVHDAMRRVVGELARLGYVGLWRCLRAADFGASHQRKRVFLVAYCDCGTDQRRRVAGELAEAAGTESREGDQWQRDGHAADDSSAELANGSGRGRRELRQPSGEAGLTDGRGEDVADTTDPDRGPRVAQEQRQTELPEQRTGWNLPADSSHDLENSSRHEQSRSQRQSGRVRRRGVRQASEPMADSRDGFLSQPRRRPHGRDGIGPASEILSDTRITRLPDAEHEELSGAFQLDERRTTPELLRGAPFPFAPGPADSRWPAILNDYPDLAPALESPVRGVADGLSDSLDRAMTDRTKRLSRLGNSVVPQIAEWLGLQLLECERSRSDPSALSRVQR